MAWSRNQFNRFRALEMYANVIGPTQDKDLHGLELGVGILESFVHHEVMN